MTTPEQNEQGDAQNEHKDNELDLEELRKHWLSLDFRKNQVVALTRFLQTGSSTLAHQAAGVSERSWFLWQSKNPRFKQELERLRTYRRTKIVDRVEGALNEHGIDALINILKERGASATEKVNATKALSDLYTKLIEQVDTARKLEEVRLLLEQHAQRE